MGVFDSPSEVTISTAIWGPMRQGRLTRRQASALEAALASPWMVAQPRLRLAMAEAGVAVLGALTAETPTRDAAPSEAELAMLLTLLPDLAEDLRAGVDAWRADVDEQAWAGDQ